MKNKVVIGTDYGHFDPSSEVDAISVFKGKDGISKTAMTKILYDKPKALYGLQQLIPTNANAVL